MMAIPLSIAETVSPEAIGKYLSVKKLDECRSFVCPVHDKQKISKLKTKTPLVFNLNFILHFLNIKSNSRKKRNELLTGY